MKSIRLLEEQRRTRQMQAEAVDWLALCVGGALWALTALAAVWVHAARSGVTP